MQSLQLRNELLVFWKLRIQRSRYCQSTPLLHVNYKLSKMTLPMDTEYIPCFTISKVANIVISWQLSWSDFCRILDHSKTGHGKNIFHLKYLESISADSTQLVISSIMEL